MQQMGGSAQKEERKKLDDNFLHTHAHTFYIKKENKRIWKCNPNVRVNTEREGERGVQLEKRDFVSRSKRYIGSVVYSFKKYWLSGLDYITRPFSPIFKYSATKRDGNKLYQSDTKSCILEERERGVRISVIIHQLIQYEPCANNPITESEFIAALHISFESTICVLFCPKKKRGAIFFF